MRRWTSWWLALQQPAGGRSQMADGEGREGRWWPVGGLARTKPAALRATRLHPCVVTLGLASNTPRRRPLNKKGGGEAHRVCMYLGGDTYCGVAQTSIST